MKRVQNCAYPWRFLHYDFFFSRSPWIEAETDFENNLRKITFKTAWFAKAFILLEDPGVGATRDRITLKIVICANLRESQVDCL